MVNTMNDNISETLNDELLSYQVGRFQGLIEEIVHCCQVRTAYLSAKFDLPQAELRCLMLFKDEKYLTVKGIAKKLDVAKSRVTKIIEGLMRKKLVESIDDPQDGRIKLISLTPAGKAACETIGSFNTGIHKKLVLELGPEDRKVVLSSLESLRTSMEAIKKQLV
jgi:DNA-binding MarR family transcriptional regulator